MTPFEVVYGHLPPSLLDYVGGTSVVVAVKDLLQSRTSILQSITENLQWAQVRIRNQANAKRTDVTFQIGDYIFLKLQPYHQTSVASRQSHKLAKRFFGHF